MYALSAALLLLLLQTNWHKLLRRSDLQPQWCHDPGHTGERYDWDRLSLHWKTLSDNAWFSGLDLSKTVNARHVSGEFDGGDQAAIKLQQKPYPQICTGNQ